MCLSSLVPLHVTLSGYDHSVPDLDLILPNGLLLMLWFLLLFFILLLCLHIITYGLSSFPVWLKSLVKSLVIFTQEHTNGFCYLHDLKTWWNPSDIYLGDCRYSPFLTLIICFNSCISLCCYVHTQFHTPTLKVNSCI